MRGRATPPIQGVLLKGMRNPDGDAVIALPVLRVEVWQPLGPPPLFSQRASPPSPLATRIPHPPDADFPARRPIIMLQRLANPANTLRILKALVHAPQPLRLHAPEEIQLDLEGVGLACAPPTAQADPLWGLAVHTLVLDQLVIVSSTRRRFTPHIHGVLHSPFVGI